MTPLTHCPFCNHLLSEKTNRYYQIFECLCSTYFRQTLSDTFFQIALKYNKYEFIQSYYYDNSKNNKSHLYIYFDYRYLINIKNFNLMDIIHNLDALENKINTLMPYL